MQTSLQSVPTAIGRPLIVKLNGALVKSNTVLDSFLMLARHQPSLLLAMPRWLMAGRRAFWARVESAASLDVTHLPYNRELLAYLMEESATGRSIYLASDSDGKLAQRIVEHLGIFEQKLILTRDREGGVLGSWPPSIITRDFDMVGSRIDDLPYLRDAAEPMLANPRRSLVAALGKHGISVRTLFTDRISGGKKYSRAIRLHQWAKNFLLFVPLLLAHVIQVKMLTRTIVAFASFCLCASATYIVNDLLDLDADRRHPTKQLRPFAAGDLSASSGLAIVLLFLGLSIAAASAISGVFLGWLLAYLVLTLAYSFWLKRVVLVDVIVLAGLYTIRLLAGAAVGGITISPWLGGFSLFLFLSLAMVKRFSELENLRAGGQIPRNGRGYHLLDLELLRTIGIASGYASILVFAMYITGHEVVALYRYPNRMWMIAPLLIWWISRFWLLAGRGEMDEDPVVFALTDRTSLLICAAIAIIGVLAL